MAINYTLKKNPPSKKTEEEFYYPCFISSGNVGLSDFMQYSENRSTINSSDVAGVMQNLKSFIEYQLKQGHTVKIEGIGSFGLSLQSTSIRKGEKIRSESIKVKNVTFKASVQLKDALSMATIRKKKETVSKTLTFQERIQRLFNYLDKKKCINALQYKKINNCSYYMARKDLIQLVKEHQLIRNGIGRFIYYVKEQ